MRMTRSRYRVIEDALYDYQEDIERRNYALEIDSRSANYLLKLINEAKDVMFKKFGHRYQEDVK